MVVRAALLLVLAACGGAKPASADVGLDNRSGPIADSPAPAGEEAAARVIARSATGGEIELTAHTGPAFDQAKEHMERHCGAGSFVIQGVERQDAQPRELYRMRYACVTSP